jgi:DNA-binding NarL/FixJ family response regulator
MTIVKQRQAESAFTSEGNEGNASVLGLSPIQVMVLAGLRQGKPNKTIANDLDLCETEVVVQAKLALRTLNLSDRGKIFSCVDILITKMAR